MLIKRDSTLATLSKSVWLEDHIQSTLSVCWLKTLWNQKKTYQDLQENALRILQVKILCNLQWVII